MNQPRAEMEIEELFEMARELFLSDDRERRDAATLFFCDVWQLNRLWRAFHDPANEQAEILIVARLLGVHRNTVTRKLRQLDLSVADFLAAESIPQLIGRSRSLRSQQRTLTKMWAAEQSRKDELAPVD